MGFRRKHALAILTLLAAGFACSGKSRAPNTAAFSDDELDATAPAADGVPLIEVSTLDGPPSPDAAGFCGNFFFKASPEPPNLYLLLDRSGSMANPSGQSNLTRYEVVQVAVVNLARKLGDRANYGVAVFPGDPVEQGCETGIEVFKTQSGDPQGTAGNGPVTTAIATATNVTPVGGTPTAVSLVSLLPTLASLSGKTALVLATDGGPNCNGSGTCNADNCTYNIEGGSVGGKLCTSSYNCCDESVPNGPGPYMCLDSVATIQAVQQLRDAGIRTFIVGIPGSTYYATLLDQLATIGGSARPTEPFYYRVDDMSALSNTLLQIGAKVLISCKFTLDQVPPDSAFVNVYFDQDVVAYDEQNGWSWTGATTLELHGEACQKLESGVVGQVQVVAGCPTEQPR
jgi:hypothetical protein